MFCRKCGSVINDGDLFCSNCGIPVNDDGNSIIDKDDLEYYDYEYDPKESKNYKKIISIIAVIFIVILIGGGVFLKLNSANRRESISLVGLNVINYPNIQIEIKSENFSNDLSQEKLIIKEDDNYQNEFDLEKNEDDAYTITYETSNRSNGGNVNVTVAYETSSGEESLIKTSYDAPKESKTPKSTVVNNTDNSVNTYDVNENKVKSAIDIYEKAYINMVDHKDTAYIRNAIDLSGNLIGEFDSTMKNFKEQKIDETLKHYEIENIKKFSDDKYEVTVLENYIIYYGSKKQTKNVDYKTKYIVTKTSNGFRVNSIEKIDEL